jgi:hypothetical protein
MSIKIKNIKWLYHFRHIRDMNEEGTCEEEVQRTGRTVKGRFESISQQRIELVRINDHAYLIPCVQEGNKVLLKDFIPSKKATNKYVRVEK